MNKNLKQRWIEALRSGKYQQTRYVLRRDAPTVIGNETFGVNVPAGHCCLGVLCDLVAPDEWDLHNPPIIDQTRGHPFYEDGHLAYNVGGEESQEILEMMNDNGKTFAEIADWIEENVPEEE